MNKPPEVNVDDVDAALREIGERKAQRTKAREAKSNSSQTKDRVEDVELVFQRMSDVEAQPVEWIWKNRIARRKVTLIAGDPGIGKSQVGCDVIARITTTSTEWPDGGWAPTGSVVVLSAEDATADTLRPRCEAAGADLDKVHTLEAVKVGKHHRTFNLQTDLERLGDKVASLTDTMLVVIDPITSYMGKIDSHRTTDVRTVLEPLNKFAASCNVGIFAVSHPPKATQIKALYAITGSLAYVADARLVLLAIEEPETDRRLLLSVKNNLGRLAPGIGFRLAQRFVDDGEKIIASYVEWDKQPVTVSANEALSAVVDHAKRGADRREAKDFLRELLMDGPKPAKVAEEAAIGQGISLITLRRAREELRVVIGRDGFQGPSIWSLPA